MQNQNPFQTGRRTFQFPTSITAPLDLVGGNGFGRYPKISSEQTTNMIISDNCLVNYAGYQLQLSILQNREGRTIYNADKLNALISVIDRNVYVISATFTYTQVGTLQTTVGPAWIADNLAGQIAITDATQNVYIYDYSLGTFSTIPVDFVAGRIDYQDTYFICPSLGTNNWRLSLESDGTQWIDGANYVGELQSKATVCVATVVLDRQVAVMGTTVTEPWSDQGLQLFPYVRNSFYCINFGTINADTVASGYGMLVWLSSNEQTGNRIMVSQELAPPQAISTDGYDYLLGQLTAPQDSYAMLYEMHGHIIYHITFTTDNLSFIYDFNTNMFFTLTDENGNYHPAKKVAFFNNSYYFISINDGNIYKFNAYITYYQYGTTVDTLKMIPRTRVGKNIRFPDADRFVIQNINITQESGINGIINQPDPAFNPTFPGALAQTRLDYSFSTDGGYSFGNIGSEYLPLLGKTENRFDLWNCGGIENDFVYKITWWTYGRIVIVSGEISLYP